MQDKQSGYTIKTVKELMRNLKKAALPCNALDKNTMVIQLLK